MSNHDLLTKLQLSANDETLYLGWLIRTTMTPHMGAYIDGSQSSDNKFFTWSLHKDLNKLTLFILTLESMILIGSDRSSDTWKDGLLLGSK